MSSISTLKTALQSQISGRTENKFAQLSKNSRKSADNGYYISHLATTQAESQGTTRNLTFNSQFEVLFSNSFDSSTTTANEQVKLDIISDELLTLFQKLVKNKAGYPSVVINIFDSSITNVQILEEDKMCSASLTFSVLWRQTLN